MAFSTFAARAAFAANVRTSGAPSDRFSPRPISDQLVGCRCARACESAIVWSRLPVNSSLATSLARAPPSAASSALSAGGSACLASGLEDADDDDVGGEVDRPAPSEPGFREAWGPDY